MIANRIIKKDYFKITDEKEFLVSTIFLGMHYKDAEEIYGQCTNIIDYSYNEDGTLTNEFEVIYPNGDICSWNVKDDACTKLGKWDLTKQELDQQELKTILSIAKLLGYANE